MGDNAENIKQVIFDVYDKVEQGFVEKKHLDIRMNSLRLGVMKSDAGKGIWAYMKINRDNKFIEWFEYEIYEREYFINEEQRERSKGLNTIRE